MTTIQEEMPGPYTFTMLPTYLLHQPNLHPLVQMLMIILDLLQLLLLTIQQQEHHMMTTKVMMSVPYMFTMQLTYLLLQQNQHPLVQVREITLVYLQQLRLIKQQQEQLETMTKAVMPEPYMYTMLIIYPLLQQNQLHPVLIVGISLVNLQQFTVVKQQQEQSKTTIKQLKQEPYTYMMLITYLLLLQN